jgi:hypothetical protein
MAQTAVEWLVQEILLKHPMHYKSIVEQAKQMEKDQIVDAHLTGLIHPLEIEATKQAEQYYNETYGNNTEKTQP